MTTFVFIHGRTWLTVGRAFKVASRQVRYTFPMARAPSATPGPLHLPHGAGA
jgi:hypothetical protein